MNYKIEGAIRRNRGNLIIFLILWLFIAICFVAPVSYAWHASMQGETRDMGIFIQEFSTSIGQPHITIGKIFTEGATQGFLKLLGGTTLIFGIFFFVGMAKTAPKNEYSDIEHGSSDWSQRGEQYRILSNKKGIILAEDNYLPVDKRGNVNVLVVGRFRFW